MAPYEGGGKALRTPAARLRVNPGATGSLRWCRGVAHPIAKPSVEPEAFGPGGRLKLQDDSRVPALSAELGIAVAAFSEVRRPGSGEIRAGGYTYHWSGRLDGQHKVGVAIAVADQVASQIKEVTSVSERIMRLWLAHSLGVVSFVAVYAPTGTSGLSAKEDFYAEVSSVVDAVPGRDTLIVLGDFNAVAGTCRDGYEACVGPDGSGNFPNWERDTSSTMMLDFARSHGLRVGGSWFQRPDSWRWTWYSNTGLVRKKIDHVLVDGRWTTPSRSEESGTRPDSAGHRSTAGAWRGGRVCRELGWERWWAGRNGGPAGTSETQSWRLPAIAFQRSLGIVGVPFPRRRWT
ncbi:craniofacial development protein 2-like [Syngnathus acus]|uniref:craniofacial development protein 2-like n=1 Tax=Syngnathus acus TaxID=161584 RepID=UPI001885C2EC|nr:craniofacial development protein 2-like [Syngnathus acus]